MMDVLSINSCDCIQLAIPPSNDDLVTCINMSATADIANNIEHVKCNLPQAATTDSVSHKSSFITCVVEQYVMVFTHYAPYLIGNIITKKHTWQ